MKPSELRDLSIEELGAKGQELRSELFNAKMKKSTGQLEDNAKLGTLRKEIARVETLLREKRGATT